MNFNQVIPFDVSKGGNIPNLCLDNVRKGYGISNKYGSAWIAWTHTQQHTDKNVPTGLDVPLYYSYTTTIDGITANYGHINVRLKNGTVWSDGNIYSSIDDYTSKKLPKFVGWGESVNDFKIIEGAVMGKPNADEVRAYFKGFEVTGLDGVVGAPSQGQIDYYTKNTYDVILSDILSDVWNRYNALRNANPSDYIPYSGNQLFTKK